MVPTAPPTTAPAPAATPAAGPQRGPDGRFAPTRPGSVAEALEEHLEPEHSGDGAAEAQEPLPDHRFLDRELSWLAFNERVLELAEDPALPLLERARFLAIFASNLDEFFMVRVAGLKRRIAAGLAVRAASGLEPREVLAAISKRAHELATRHAAAFTDHVRPALADHDITLVGWDALSHREREGLGDFFRESIFPVLTPLAVDPAHPFPYISGLSLNLAVVVRNTTTEKEHFARVKVPPLLPRLVMVPEDLADTAPATGAGASTTTGAGAGTAAGASTAPRDGEAAGTGGRDDRRGRGPEQGPIRFVPVERIIAQHLDQLFPGMDVVAHHTFRVTRNEDLEVEEDDAENLLQALEKELLRRRFGPPVRLEVAEDTPEQTRELLLRELGVNRAETYVLPEPLDLRGLNTVADLGGSARSDLGFPTFVPRTHLALTDGRERSGPSDVFAALRARDVLLHHPYDSFSTSVQAFLEQAAADPDVLAIKQTLYRTSGDSPIVDALIAAAEAGKQVLALVEIKARFDEQANIDWARKLERSGVHVVYGIVGLKTHSKLCLVVRQEGTLLRRYCHIGTGNYNPKTARLYEDLGLLTSDEEVGEDLTKLFNQLSGYAPKTRYSRLLVAPRGVRRGLVERIEREVECARAGEPARVRFKVNSMVDEAVIDALYRASQAGVPVDVVVRGICSLRPGVPGLSETIRVRSVLGRFLEHSRIFSFEGGGEREVWIGSADMMHRNLDRRIEALVRLRDGEHLAELTELLDTSMDEGTVSWHLGPDGRWTRPTIDGGGLDLQEQLISRASRRRARR